MNPEINRGGRFYAILSGGILLSKGSTLRAIRDAKGMTIAEVSDRICSPGTLSKIENDRHEVS